MKALVNLLVDKQQRISHVLMANGNRACSCRVPKSAIVVERVDLSVPPPDHHWNVCEPSWNKHKRELERLEKWTQST